MELIADGLLIAGAISAAFYCYVLSRRVRRLTNLDDGLGAAIAQMSRQVEDMRRALKATQATSDAAVAALQAKIAEADGLAARLEELGEEYAPRKSPQTRKRRPTAPATQRAASPAPAAAKAPTKARPNPAKQTSDKAQPLAQRLASLVPPEKPAQPQAQKSATATNTKSAADAIERKRSAARQLQEDIRKRVRGGPDKEEKDNFVKALQTVLASASK